MTPAQIKDTIKIGDLSKTSIEETDMREGATIEEVEDMMTEIIEEGVEMLIEEGTTPKIEVKKEPTSGLLDRLDQEATLQETTLVMKEEEIKKEANRTNRAPLPLIEEVNSRSSKEKLLRIIMRKTGIKTL